MPQSTTQAGSATVAGSDPKTSPLRRATSDPAASLPDGQSKRSTEKCEPPEPSAGSRNVTPSSNSTPSLSVPSKVSGSATIGALSRGLQSQYSARLAPTDGGRDREKSKGEGEGEDEDNDEENYEDSDEEKVQPTITKRHSSRSHTNVYTECGRHSDSWLFEPVSILSFAKDILGKK